jgi:hypothetical protein
VSLSLAELFAELSPSRSPWAFIGKRTVFPGQCYSFKFRWGQYFWRTRAVIGHGAARVVALCAKVAGHTLRRPGAPPNARDTLLFTATVPWGV